jgi:hypothetical protein
MSPCPWPATGASPYRNGGRPRSQPFGYLVQQGRLGAVKLPGEPGVGTGHRVHVAFSDRTDDAVFPLDESQTSSVFVVRAVYAVPVFRIPARRLDEDFIRAEGVAVCLQDAVFPFTDVFRESASDAAPLASLAERGIYVPPDAERRLEPEEGGAQHAPPDAAAPEFPWEQMAVTDFPVYLLPHSGVHGIADELLSAVAGAEVVYVVLGFYREVAVRQEMAILVLTVPEHLFQKQEFHLHQADVAPSRIDALLERIQAGMFRGG